MANSLVIISSLEVQIQTYTNIEKSRFLLTPNLRMLDFLWHLPPTTPPESQFSQFFEAAANAFSLVHALRRHAEEVPQRGDVAFPGRLVDVVASGPEAEGKNQLKNDIQKTTKNWRTLAFGLKFWPFCLANCERSIQIQ